MMKKKIYLKIYQDKENLDGNYYIETIENFIKSLPDIIKDCSECNILFPIAEPIEMTEDEFSKLPEFTGY